MQQAAVSRRRAFGIDEAEQKVVPIPRAGISPVFCAVDRNDAATYGFDDRASYSIFAADPRTGWPKGPRISKPHGPTMDALDAAVEKHGGAERLSAGLVMAVQSACSRTPRVRFR